MLFFEKDKEYSTILQLIARNNAISLEVLLDSDVFNKLTTKDKESILLVVKDIKAVSLLQPHSTDGIEVLHNNKVFNISSEKVQTSTKMPSNYYSLQDEKDKYKDCAIFGSNGGSESAIFYGLFVYYQKQVSILLKLRLEAHDPELLNKVEIFERCGVWHNIAPSLYVNSRSFDAKCSKTTRASERHTINLDGKYYSDTSLLVAEDIAEFVLSSDRDMILVPMNIGGQHLVGIAASKDGSNVHLSYIDSEQNPMPLSLKLALEDVFLRYNKRVTIEEVIVEKQQFNNCGPEVVENLAFYVTGKRVPQNVAPLLHSKLFEASLLNIEVKMNETFDEKLLAQVAYYLETGEMLESMRGAVSTGNVVVRANPITEPVVPISHSDPQYESFNDSEENFVFNINHNAMQQYENTTDYMSVIPILLYFWYNTAP